jgi:murein DD-endopeptidase MepM/ murein hydrolase activator NlpD
MSPVKKLLPVLALLSPILVLATPAPAAGSSTEPHGFWPLRPTPAVVHPFAPPDTTWGSGHRGVDLAGTVGQPVRTALPGTVSYVGTIAGVGVVVVDHGTTRTTYQPVEAQVEVGAEVAAGAVLGRLTWYGTHCLPAACLHWGLVEGDRYLDPLTLVGGPSPVRLLPLDAGPVLPSRTQPPAPATVLGWYGFPLPGIAPGP